jgi:hypothetical protein
MVILPAMKGLNMIEQSLYFCADIIQSVVSDGREVSSDERFFHPWRFCLPTRRQSFEVSIPEMNVQ